MEFLRNILRLQIAQSIAGAGGLRCFIIPSLIAQHLQMLLHFLYFLLDKHLLCLNHLQPLRNGLVAFHAPVDENFDVLDRHAGVFQALDDIQPFKIGILEHANAAVRAFDEGQKSFFVIVPQGRGGNIHAFCHLSDCIKHDVLSGSEKVQKEDLT